MAQNLMESRLIDIELHLMQQEETVRQLDDVIIAQQKTIERLEKDVEYLKEKLRALNPSNIRDLSEEEPPPHY